MTYYRKKIFLTALILLFFLETIAVFVSYRHARNLIITSLINSRQNELRSIALNIDNTYNVAKKKLELITSELRQTTYIEQLESVTTLSERADTVRKLQYSLFSKLTAQSELNAFYVITGNMVAGYNTSNDMSTYTSFDQPYTWSKTPNDDIFLLLSQNMPYMLLFPQELIISQIAPGQYLAGVLDWENILKKWHDNLIVYNDEGRLLFSTPYTVDLGDLRSVANTGKPLAIQNKSYLISNITLYKQGLNLFLLTDTQVIESKLNPVFSLTLCYAALITFIFGILLFFLSKLIVSSLYKFNVIVNNIQMYNDTQMVDEYISAQKRKRKFGQKVFYYYITNFIPLIITILLCLRSYSLLIKEDTLNAYTEAISQTEQEIEYTINSQILYANYISLNDMIQNYLVSLKRNDQMNTDAGIEEISRYLIDQITSRNINYIKLYDSNFNLVFSSSSDENDIDQHTIDYMNESTHFNLWLQHPDHISFVKRVSYLPQSNQLLPYFARLGYLEMGIDSQLLSMESMINNGFQCIADASGQLVDVNIQSNFSPDYVKEFAKAQLANDVFGTIISCNGSNMFYSNRRINNTDWKLISCFETEAYVSENTQILFFSIIAFLVLFLVLNQASRMFSQNALQPMEKLQDYMKRLEYGQVPTFDFGNKENEFVSLANSFRAMLIRLNTLNTEIQRSIAEKAEFEKRKKEAQFVALQTQIDPHFLHNIFTSITMLLKMGKTDDAIKMLQSTGKLLRIGIYSGDSIVPVCEEINHILAYVELQKIRYADRIRLDIHNRDEIQSLKMPKLILQPLVENAIEHNLKVQKSIHIEIDFQISEDDLTIIMRDNGIGIEKENLEDIQSRLANNTYSGHIGLVNINERIRLYFGEAYGINIDSSVGIGTTIYVHIPKLSQG